MTGHSRAADIIGHFLRFDWFTANEYCSLVCQELAQLEQDPVIVLQNGSRKRHHKAFNEYNNLMCKYQQLETQNEFERNIKRIKKIFEFDF